MAQNIFIILKISAIMISLVCIVGNALVCHVIVRLKTMKTSINYIILNLAILDAISGFLTIYFVILNDNRGVFGEPVLQQAYNQSVILAEVLCRIEWSYWFTTTVSPQLLMVMAYERYKAIVHPFSRLNGAVTKASLKVILAFAWMFGLGYFIIDVIVVRYDKRSGTCKDTINFSWYNAEVSYLFYLVTQYIIPSTAMFIFYLRLICALKKQDNAIGPQAEAERARRKAKKKVTWIIIVVTLTFYICCGIPHIVHVFNTGYSNVFVEYYLIWDILVIMLAFNSAFNPFVYFIFIQSFRDGFKRVFISRQTNNPSNNLRLGRNIHSSSLENPNVSDNSRLPQLLAIVNHTSH